jgi:hypothetical protein
VRVISIESMLGAAYLESLPRGARRQSGQVYTPAHVVGAILDWAGYESALDTPRGVLLDPACGAGAFLEAAVRLRVEHLVRQGTDFRTTEGRAALLRAVEENVFGIDVDPQAVPLAVAAVRNVVAQACPGAPLPAAFFRRNVLTADFLLAPDAERLVERLGEGFDFIVGNPPYVSTVRLAARYKDALRERFASATGRVDLYTVFMERAMGLLRAGGTLAFITPDKYLASQTARPLRALLLQHGSIRLLGRFRSHKVFADAATVPCVTVFERGRRPGPVQLLECRVPQGRAEVRVVRRSRVPFTQLSSSRGWGFTAPALARLEGLIQGRHPTLRTHASRISAGIATGRDGIYVGRAGGFDVEDELLVPVVRGRDLQPFVLSDPALAMVLPYAFDRLGRPALIDLGDYPRARRFFARHRRELESRHCVRVWEKAWYDLHDPMPLHIGRTPKILVPDVASHNRFVFEAGRYWPLHSVYYIVPTGIDGRFLTALLNSTPIELLIRVRAPVVKDGFSRYRKQFLAGLPVPQASPRAQSAIVEAATAGDRAETDRLVARLFGLGPESMDAARELLVSLLKPAVE